MHLCVLSSYSIEWSHDALHALATQPEIELFHLPLLYVFSQGHDS